MGFNSAFKDLTHLLTNKEIYSVVKKPHYNSDNKVKYITSGWACTESGREQNSPKNVLYMNLETTRLSGRPRNRQQDKLREDGRLVSRKKGYITERNRGSS